MKKLVALSLSFLLLTSLSADDVNFEYLSGSEYGYENEDPFYPFLVTLTALQLSDATLTRPDRPDEHLRYAQLNAALAYTFPFSPIWGLIFGAGYVGTELKWKENPSFHENTFGYVSFSGGGFTKAMPDWEWVATATMFVDTAVLDLSEYALYVGVLTGKYAISECLLIDSGFILEVGLRQSKIWPILGFEFDPPDDDWTLHIVYPIDIAFEYFFTDYLSAAVSARFLRDHHRVTESNPVPMAIYQYETAGVEGDLLLNFDHLYLKGFVGSTFRANLRITNRNNDDPEYFKFGNAWYGGGSVVFKF